jgi:hypothetical protein
LASLKQSQALMMLRQQTMTNPALAQVMQQEISPIKEYKMFLRSNGIDPEDLRPDPGEQQMDPMLLANQSGGQNPMGGPPQDGGPPPNQMGERGIQSP